MTDLKDIICNISIWIFQFYYKEVMEELDGDGEDTREIAFDRTYSTLAEAGFVAAEIIDNVLKIYMLNPSKLLVFYVKDGKPRVFMHISDKLKEKYGFDLKAMEYHISADTSHLVEIYNETEPYITTTYGMIKDGIMSWEDAFELC